jgi:hypothetical protein
MSVRDYSHLVKQVIQWNDIANKLKDSYSEEDVDNQKSRVIEELNEAFEAYNDKNSIELRDAICDIFVTACYLDFMVNYKDESFYRRYKKTTSTMYKEAYLIPAFNKIKEAIELNSYDKLAYYIFRMCESINVDIKRDIEKVLDNNNTKFLDTEEDAVKSVNHYKSQNQDVFFLFNEKYNKFVILRKLDNKVMKPLNFVSVSLENEIAHA